DMLVVTEQLQTYLARMSGGTANQQDLYEMAGNFLFRQDDLKKNIGMLSGGEKARLCLAGLLLQKNDVLLLDEPTNHLDFETVEALANALEHSRMTILFVSHNRTFVNTIATSIIEVGGGKVVRSHHDYENYVYHLKEQLHIQEKIIATPPKQKIELKLARIEIQKILKEEKKLLRDTELEMMELEKEKQDLLHWFEKNTDTFSRLKQDAFQDVTQKLQAAEEQWFVRQEYIQELEVELHGLR
nr:ABC-F family ATP-binding cassette domain-containing protein [Candidatus Magasanikbacteria bacterium]